MKPINPFKSQPGQKADATKWNKKIEKRLSEAIASNGWPCLNPVLRHMLDSHTTISEIAEAAGINRHWLRLFFTFDDCLLSDMEKIAEVMGYGFKWEWVKKRRSKRGDIPIGTKCPGAGKDTSCTTHDKNVITLNFNSGKNQTDKAIKTSKGTTAPTGEEASSKTAIASSVSHLCTRLNPVLRRMIKGHITLSELADAAGIDHWHMAQCFKSDDCFLSDLEQMAQALGYRFKWKWVKKEKVQVGS